MKQTCLHCGTTRVQNGLSTELVKSVNMPWNPGMEVYREQRWRDLSCRHLVRVAIPFLETGEAKATKEWIPILFTPCGRIVKKFEKDHTPRTAEKVLRIR